jgi:hypothetical protein
VLGANAVFATSTIGTETTMLTPAKSLSVSYVSGWLIAGLIAKELVTTPSV